MLAEIFQVSLCMTQSTTTHQGAEQRDQQQGQEAELRLRALRVGHVAEQEDHGRHGPAAQCGARERKPWPERAREPVREAQDHQHGQTEEAACLEVDQQRRVVHPAGPLKNRTRRGFRIQQGVQEDENSEVKFFWKMFEILQVGRYGFEKYF